jgi:hypothetical protein
MLLCMDETQIKNIQCIYIVQILFSNVKGLLKNTNDIQKPENIKFEFLIISTGTLKTLIEMQKIIKGTPLCFFDMV